MSANSHESSRRCPVVLVPYDSRWPEMFEEEKTAILRVLGARALAIEHIGSLAVPGLLARATIDIMVGIRRLDEALVCIDHLRDIGYVYVPEYEDTFPDRRYLHKGPPGARSHHLHMVEFGSPFWMAHILFRDILRTHPQRSQDYAALKERLANEHPSDRSAYRAARTTLYARQSPRRGGNGRDSCRLGSSSTWTRTPFMPVWSAGRIRNSSASP